MYINLLSKRLVQKHSRPDCTLSIAMRHGTCFGTPDSAHEKRSYSELTGKLVTYRTIVFFPSWRHLNI